MADPDVEELLHAYLQSTIKATKLLFDNQLYGQWLVLVYSTVDTLGLLDAPPDQESATGASFKAFAKTYLLPHPGMDCTESDLWSARCAVLHSFTSQSDLTRAGKAREIQYYGGDKDSPRAKLFVEVTNQVEGGRHLAIHFGDLFAAFLLGVRALIAPLTAKCSSDPKVTARLRNVLHIFPMDDL